MSPFNASGRSQVPVCPKDSFTQPNVGMFWLRRHSVRHIIMTLAVSPFMIWLIRQGHSPPQTCGPADHPACQAWPRFSTTQTSSKMSLDSTGHFWGLVRGTLEWVPFLICLSLAVLWCLLAMFQGCLLTGLNILRQMTKVKIWYALLPYFQTIRVGN